MDVSSLDANDRIERVFRNMATSSRLLTAQTVANDYASPSLGGDDLRLAELILKFLINDVEATVRATIARTLKDFEGLPRDIALKLAMDVEEVATPILAFSPALTDRDLMDILESASEAKQLAVSERKTLPEPVTDTLIRKGTGRVICRCLENPGARISDAGYQTIILEFSTDQSVHTLLVRRPDLSRETVGRLCKIVSASLKQELLQNGLVPEEIAEQITANAREQALVGQIARRISIVEKKRAAVQLEADGRLTATLMLRSLLSGDFSFFAAALSQFTGFSIKRVTSLISSDSYDGFKRLYERALLPPYLYPAFKTTLRETRRLQRLNPRADGVRDQNRLIDEIALIYNYPKGLSIEELMEKLLPH
ncbi:DUF2336 domain-containing protein [Sneathiella chinensis]|uniref:DUF2336 domain-containing protein n=1 Tax=Sneathiella chinensis TaxID=349750 RepID=A0ABQ5U7B7_9PROT|nr:DUF2336 domain-containing protein [Sneathiella chinensis]GLQ08002.1 hypothetical protein GCM10007924_32240 [Sneathiella chinensis]